MNMKIVLAGLLVVLMTTGSQCINDGFLVAVNLPISKTWAINPGPTTTFGGSATAIVLANQLDASYKDKVKNARYYDIRVSVGGTYAGNVNGTASINGTRLLSFSGSWANFQTPQSLLGSSSHITPDPAGVAVLVSALNAFSTNPAQVVSLSANGSLSQGPVPSGLTFTVEILAQVDAEVGDGD
jgi:hypothetical protein